MLQTVLDEQQVLGSQDQRPRRKQLGLQLVSERFLPGEAEPGRVARRARAEAKRVLGRGGLFATCIASQ